MKWEDLHKEAPRFFANLFSGTFFFIGITAGFALMWKGMVFGEGLFLSMFGVGSLLLGLMFLPVYLATLKGVGQ